MSSPQPEPAALREAAARLRERAAETALLFDIDGTLAPIVGRPEDAGVPPATSELLGRLAERYALVGCVSGRQALVARRLTGLSRLTYIGNHGLERLDPGASTPQMDPALGAGAGAAELFVAGLEPARLEGACLTVEDKGPIQALHWREAPDQERAEKTAREIAAEAPAAGLVPHWGRKVLELRPSAKVDKGTAVRRLLAGRGLESALYAGDDRTDLDVFRALRELEREGELATALCVGVASAEGPVEIQAEADIVVGGTDGIIDLLRELAS